MLELLELEPGLTSSQISERLKAKPNSVRTMIWKLVQANKLERKEKPIELVRGPKSAGSYYLTPMAPQSQ